MTHYTKPPEPEMSVKELLELSTLYHRLITDLCDLWGVTLTPALRAQAFQIITDAGEQVKMKTLAATVVSELPKESSD